MFTGIITEVGTVKTIRRGDPWTVTIQASNTTEDLAVGASISVSGVCLTATRVQTGEFDVQVSRETRNRSVFNTLTTSSKVNLERALKITDRLDGHLVLGHVDDTGVIKGISGRSEKIFLIRPRQNPGANVVMKGSITIDGVSLTIADVKPNGEFSVTLIPHTIRNTTFESKAVGHHVNLEYDILGKYVAQNMRI
jgi:riboflavin synthase